MIDRVEIRMRCLELVVKDKWPADNERLKAAIDALEKIVLEPVIAEMEEADRLSKTKGNISNHVIVNKNGMFPQYQKVEAFSTMETPIAAPSIHDTYMRR